MVQYRFLALGIRPFSAPVQILFKIISKISIALTTINNLLIIFYQNNTFKVLLSVFPFLLSVRWTPLARISTILLLRCISINMSDTEERDLDENVVSTPEPRPSTAQTSPSELIATTQAWAKVARSFIYVEVSSLVLMFSALGIWSDYYYSFKAYALSVAVISLGLCLLIQTGEFIRPG